jgi:hypothetical protein
MASVNIINVIMLCTIQNTMTFSILTLAINDSQHNNTVSSDITLNAAVYPLQ